METEERKQGSPGNEANDGVCVHILLSDTDSDHLVLQCDAVQYGHSQVCLFMAWHNSWSKGLRQGAVLPLTVCLLYVGEKLLYLQSAEMDKCSGCSDL